jgi:hypothetical protein
MIHLLEARDFTTIAETNGITRTARELVAAGQLVPVVVGRTTHYRWMDLLPLMPEWARKQHVRRAMTPLMSGPFRSGLSGRTVSVERATRSVARAAEVAAGELIAVVRLDGVLVEPIAVTGVRSPIEFARIHAGRIDARYVPGGAR